MRPGEAYEVFAARAIGEQSLQHVGTVRAREPQSAAVFAHKMYDEWRWHAMFVVPRAALIYVKKAD